MRQTKAERLREELIELRSHQEQPTYEYTGMVERRILDIQLELRQLAKTRLRNYNRRQLLYDINGHYGPA